jgi:protocatechuate 3,4-dioxygenase beta subunit
MPETHPPYLYPPYQSTVLRAPRQKLVRVLPSPLDMSGPAFPKRFVKDSEADLTQWGKGAPLGEKMILVGRVLDDAGRPVRSALVELWQCNAAGRYAHPVDQHDAPLDPNFLGRGQVLTDDTGEFRFVTIKPGAYPWRNHAFGWRPAHIHFSLFGSSNAQRLITQMFFPGDPLLPIDPIYNSSPDPAARTRMVASLALESGIEQVAMGYRFEIVLGGRHATPMGH